MAKDCLLVAAIVLSACATKADRSVTPDASSSAGRFQCTTGMPATPACSDTTQYCYAGDETGFYQGPGTIQLGCNALPSGGAPTCAYVLGLFAAGFCTCDATSGGVVMQCSFV